MIANAFGERPLLKLMYAAVIRASDRWRGIKVMNFELRQCNSIRDEIDRRHRAENVAKAQTLTAKGIKQPKRAG